MPSLIVRMDETVQAGVLTGRVLIGRKPINTIVIDHDAVSRIHAWIEQRDNQWVIGDCGSRNGTYVNGHHIDRIVPLNDGDEIHIARTTITYRETDTLPDGAEVIDLDHLEERVHSDESGFLVLCECGAPTWVPNFLGGCTRRCGHCRVTMRLPPAPTPAPTAAAAASAPSSAPAQSQPDTVCSICQCGVHADEPRTTCPDCGVTFHRDCWDENQGCSTYGCSQVNILAEDGPQAAPPATAEVETAMDMPAEPVAEHTPREYLLLAASVVATVLGALTFGAPALIVLLAAVLYLLRNPRQRGVVLASLLVSLLGVAVGVVLSYHWWLG